MEFLILLLLILLNGVFAMSEIAMVSMRKARMELAVLRGDRAAKKALELAARPGRFLSAVQIGITLIGILLGIYSGRSMEADLTAWLGRFDALRPYADTLAVTLLVVALTFFSIVLGELVPKRIGMVRPERVSRLVAWPMYVLSWMAAPFIWLLTVTSDGLIRLFGLSGDGDQQVTEEEIRALVYEGRKGGAIRAIEQDIVERTLSLGDRTVASLMTQRKQVVTLRRDADAGTVWKVLHRHMHHFYPVVDAGGQVIGAAYLRDILRSIGKPGFTLSQCIQEPCYLSETLSAYEALKLFKQRRTYQSIVIDEHGNMEGVLTINDLLEALVGDVSDFYAGEFSFVQRADGSWLADGQYPLADIMRRFDLDELIADYPYNTLGGLILHELRRIPQTGDKVDWLDFELEVVDMDGVRIDKVLMVRKGE